MVGPPKPCVKAVDRCRRFLRSHLQDHMRPAAGSRATGCRSMSVTLATSCTLTCIAGIARRPVSWTSRERQTVMPFARGGGVGPWARATVATVDFSSVSGTCRRVCREPFSQNGSWRWGGGAVRQRYNGRNGRIEEIARIFSGWRANSQNPPIYCFNRCTVVPLPSCFIKGEVRFCCRCSTVATVVKSILTVVLVRREEKHGTDATCTIFQLSPVLGAAVTSWPVDCLAAIRNRAARRPPADWSSSTGARAGLPEEAGSGATNLLVVRLAAGQDAARAPATGSLRQRHSLQ